MNKEVKKITFLISSFRVGGGERIMIDLANEFSRRGYPVDLIVLSGIGEYQGQIDKAVRQIRIDARRMLFSLPKIISYLRKESPRVMLTGDEHTSIYTIIARYVSGSKTKVALRVGTMYSRLLDLHKGFNKRYFTLLTIKFLCKYADLVIAVSKGIADDVVSAMGVEREKVVVVYNPKPIEFIQQKLSEHVEHPWLNKKTLPVVMSVGRFRLPKNFQGLIRAFSVIRKSILTRLILVGRGRDNDELRDLAKKLGCEDDVSFPGYSDNPYAWMSKADIFVLPSLWEGMPNAVLEAMACGLPVISSDCSSGPREILAPDTDYKFRLKKGVEYAKYGILFAVGDDDALTEAMERLLKDEELRKRYAKVGKERINDFDSKKIIGEYINALVHEIKA